MPKKRTVFITGATGLLGSYLLKILLEKGHKVYALSRTKEGKVAEDRVIETLRFWNETITNLDKLIVLDGDVTKHNLGLDNAVSDLLNNEIEEIFHYAAVTQLNSPSAELKKVNTEGTRNVMELALVWNKSTKLKKVNHFSTAYICGDYKGIFTEKDLEVGQKFNTIYEQSKFEAEKLIENYRKKGLWVDIFRPAVVVGESSTGKTFKFEHIYELFHLWSLDVLDFFPNEDNFAINFACIDQITKIIDYICNNIEIKNTTYHLFGNNPFPTKEVFGLARKYIGFKKTVLITCGEFNKKNISPIQRKIIEKINLFNTASQLKLDSAQTIDILHKHNFSFPVFDSNHFVNIVKYAKKTNFIAKTRHKPSEK
jgi:thioester reductase-like protein